MTTTDTRADLQRELRGYFNSTAALEGAVEQLEERVDALPRTFDKKFAEIRRTAWDPRGNDRGVFENEDQARAFGLIALRQARGDDAQGVRRYADEALKRDYPDIHQRIDSAADGALLPVEMSNRILRLAEAFGVAERNAFVAPMAGLQQTFPRSKGGPTVYLVGEGSPTGTSDGEFTSVNLNAKEWASATMVPNRVDDAAIIAIGSILAKQHAWAHAKKMDEIVFAGDGTAASFNTLGVPRRLLGLDDTIANIAGLQVASGNAYSEITLSDLQLVLARLPLYAHTRAKWYCSSTVFASVLHRLMLAVGGVTAAEVEGKRQLAFLGFPVELTHAMPSVEDNSQVCLLFGDLSMAVTIGRMGGMSLSSSREHKFLERQTTYLMTQNVAVNVHDVGNASATASEREPGPIVGLITAAS